MTTNESHISSELGANDQPLDRWTRVRALVKVRARAFVSTLVATSSRGRTTSRPPTCGRNRGGRRHLHRRAELDEIAIAQRRGVVARLETLDRYNRPRSSTEAHPLEIREPRTNARVTDAFLRSGRPRRHEWPRERPAISDGLAMIEPDTDKPPRARHGGGRVRYPAQANSERVTQPDAVDGGLGASRRRIRRRPAAEPDRLSAREPAFRCGAVASDPSGGGLDQRAVGSCGCG